MSNLDTLYSELDFIGIRVTAPKALKEETDIERILVKSCYYMDEDGRLLSLVFSWLTVHGTHVVADKLIKEYKNFQRYRGQTPWFSAICSFMAHLKDHRFDKFVEKQKENHHFGNRDQTKLIQVKGAVEYLQKVGIMVAKSTIRIRESDILEPKDLVKFNRQYRNRLIYGANWRAEIITELEKGETSPYRVSKTLGIAHSRVGIVAKEYFLVKDYISA